MSFDVSDLRSFYATPLGKVAGRLVGRIIRQRWDICAGFSMLGVGYAAPYLTVFREEAVRVLAFMPAEQGVVNWPASGASSSALVETMMMPLPDSCIDRVLLVHALESVEHPRQLLGEIWRILTPGGRMIVVVPNRGGLWTRVDTTPFGHGQPYSRSQLRELMRETLFSPIHWGEALYVPPFARPMLLRAAPAFERIGGRFALPGAGVYLVEATKQLYRLVGARKVARERPVLAPALAPTHSCGRFTEPVRRASLALRP
jgi:SAM-dependent methyltransferase